LIHFGDLDPVFEAAAGCLRPDGLFAFTVFPNDDDPDAMAIGTLNGLAQGGCFRHGSGYVTRTAAKHGFHVELLRREAHEYLRKSPIPGLVVVLRLKDRPVDLDL
jgi:predicted TPR repeat methyltransferase